MSDKSDRTKKQVSSHRQGRLKKKHDNRMVHGLIRKVAYEMAAVYYEQSAHDNAFYHHYPSQTFFCDYEWRRFIKHAKEKLLDILGNPHTPEAYKQDIYHAILLDAALPYSVQEAQMRPH
jgi:hypothetical protein